MSEYLLEIEASAVFSSEAPTLEILVDGVVVSSFLIEEQTGSGVSYLEYNLSYGGDYPDSLSFRFLDAGGEEDRSITIHDFDINGFDGTSYVGQMVLLQGQTSNFDTEGFFGGGGAQAGAPPFAEEMPDIADLDPVTQTGTAGDDTLSGLGGHIIDVIDGGDGNDLVHGQLGDDQLWGGNGNDNLWGNDGDDTIIGADGDDNLVGGDGNDNLWGGIGNDKLYGGDGNDGLSGNEGIDKIYGNDGDDTIYGGAGTDKLYGGEGRNTIYGGDDADKIYGGSQNDTLYGDGGNDKIWTNGGNDEVYGGLGNDKILGGSGRDTLYGEDGDDVLAGYDDNDYLDGGAGNDRLYGHGGNDTIVGGAGDDYIKGLDGGDIIDGGADNDTILAGFGNDTVDGGDGDDIIYAYNADPAGAATLRTQILNADPVGYWRLDEGSGSKADNDGSGNGIDGTYTNGVTQGAAGLYQTAAASADFDGINDYIAIPDSNLINLQGVTQRTVELVFNADTTAGRQVLYEEGGGTNALTIYIDSGNIYFNARDSGEWGPFTITTGITAGETYHAAIVLDTTGSGTLTGYLNGAFVGSGATVTDLDAHSGDIAIGAQANQNYYHDGADTANFDYFFDGRISDVALYNDAISQTVLQSHYDALALKDNPNANDGNDILRGGNGDDTLYASGGSDQLYGEGDNDTLHGSATEDDLYGGDGNDIIYADGVQITATPPPSSATTLSSLILGDSPDAYWAMDELAGTTADNQGSIGASVDGTYQNGVTLGAAALYSGGATSVEFDGVNDRIQIPDNAAINTAIVDQRTVELVFNADTTTGRQVLYEEGGTVNALTIYIEDGDIYFAARDNGEWGPFTISTSITAGQTYHTAFVLDTSGAGTFTGYLDGAVVGSGVTATSMDAHSGDIGIGWSDGGAYYHDGADGTSGYYFDGRISDVALYNAALTQADLQQRADIVAGNPITPPSIDDELYGGDGFDQLYGGNGRDAFIFESASAFNDVDEINDFDFSDYDALDISDLLTGFVDGSSDINDFVQFTEVSGNTVVSVDANGTTGGANFVDIAQINNFTGVSVDNLYDNAGIIPV